MSLHPITGACALAVVLAAAAFGLDSAGAQQPPAPPAAANPAESAPAPTDNPPTPPPPAPTPAETPAQPPAPTVPPTEPTPPAETPPTPDVQAIPPVVVEAPRPRPQPRPQPATPQRSTVPAPAQPQPAAATPEPVTSGAAAQATPPIKERFQLPQTAASITAEQIEQKINVVDTEDAVKYMPSLFVRKRNYGDTQPVLATRSWGIAYSARSLVYADDILLSALIANNNSIGSPRWGLVAPEEIKRIDFLYGPFAAMYPGNSMGGVLQITTRMPDKFEATVKQSESFQTFDFYNTRDVYRTDQTSFSIGNRWNDLAVLVSGNFQNSFSQPLGWATTAGTLAGTSGTIPQLSRTGTTANVLGAMGLLHTDMANLKGKAAVDITPWLQATYILGFWSNDGKSDVQSYLKDAAGNPTYGGNATVGGAAFASGYYTIAQKNLANAFSLKTDTKGAFDWDFAVSRFDYLQDIQRNPFTVAASGLAFTDVGKITRLDGTNWETADLKGIWRLAGPASGHELSFGLHYDRYQLVNPVYQTPTWYGGPDATSSLYSRGDGKTQTSAFWLQDAWRFAPHFKLTLGGRWESWTAYDGFNLTTTTTNSGPAAGAILTTSSLSQPTLNANRFSPKASLTWEPDKHWQVTGSFGVANRFPTVAELYQVTTIGVNLINPNPNLRPETAFASELAIERKFSDGKIRLSFFDDHTRDMLVAQTSTVAGTTAIVSFVTNVDAVRNRGAELAWQKDNILVERLELFGSVTYADSIILSDPTFVGTNGSTATGKRVPYVPLWRTTLGATYHPGDHWSFTLAARYQSKVYATLDNTDVVSNVYQAFDPFLVADMRIQYKAGDRGSISFGIDNIGNEQYHLFHPFPQRTYIVQGRLSF
jgi:iron complex outermembrane recepter protein